TAHEITSAVSQKRTRRASECREDEFAARCPLTTKDDLVEDQRSNPPYGSNHTEPFSTYTRFCQTSGTTAQPLAILDTPGSWDWMLANWAQIYAAAEVQPGDTVYFAFSFGPFLGFWTAFEAAAKCGFRCLPGGGLTSAARLRAMIRHRAQVLCCTPTYALHLTEVGASEGIDLRETSIKKIIVAGEPGGGIPAVRKRIRDGWCGAAVLDHYGMTEVGPVAYERLGEPGHLRVIENSYFAEIIDPKTTKPVAIGESGELVLTTLGRTACPLLRYRTGDLVRRAATEGFVLDGGIMGRTDDMIVVRGVNIYPAAVDSVVREVPAIGEYRVRVTHRGEMTELTLEAEAEDAATIRQLERALTEAFALRIPVAHVTNGTLPRFELKARRWVTEQTRAKP
ncbi:MAG TPA: AMP-binding protein, partial [Gemmatimonadaceae bacterium]